MLAVLSDIHGNLETLRAVLEDIAGQGIRDVYCLGDVVGYGPNPRECLDLVAGCKVVLLGNHDQAALFDPEGFCAAAAKAIFWTRQQLEASADSKETRERRWEFLAARPRHHRQGDVLYVHGSPRNPINEYLFPDDVGNRRKMAAVFALVEHGCFHGHTHIPGIFTELAPGQRWSWSSPEDIDLVHRLDGRKALINVGSVGQPRDGDPRACYVVCDGPAVRYRRVPYDIDATVNKIYAIPDLDKSLGDRLRLGR